MKILKVLIKEGAGELYRALDNMQATTLVNVADGKIDLGRIRPNTQMVMDQLVDFGALDSGYMPTSTGQMVANMVRKHGPRDARRDARRNAAAGIVPAKGDGRYSDVGDIGDNLDGEVAGVTGRGLGIGGRPNRDGAI